MHYLPHKYVVCSLFWQSCGHRIGLLLSVTTAPINIYISIHIHKRGVNSLHSLCLHILIPWSISYLHWIKPPKEIDQVPVPLLHLNWNRNLNDGKIIYTVLYHCHCSTCTCFFFFETEEIQMIERYKNIFLLN